MPMPVHACPFCTIAPPHILRRIAEAGGPAQRDAAARTLAVTGELRGERLRATALGLAAPAIALAGQVSGARSTHDAGQGRKLPGRLARAEAGAATGDAAVDEAHDHAGTTRDFLKKVFRRRSIDGRGMALVSTVHFDRDYDNAFWNGVQMVYGDGDGQVFTRFTACLDVIGHELAHGVTQHTSNLIYFEQPGALNEHFSDVIGSLVKQWHLGQDAADADWLIGAGLLMPSIRGKALRSMKAPGTAYDDPLIGKDPQPAHMDDYYHGPEDQGGVHINSGIPNRVFWRVATEFGGKAWDRAGAIWWRAFTAMLTRRASFEDAARATVDAAEEIGGRAAAKTVRAAWQEAGVRVPAAARIAAPDPRRAKAPAASSRRAAAGGRARPGTAKGAPKRSGAKPIAPPAKARQKRRAPARAAAAGKTPAQRTGGRTRSPKASPPPPRRR
jgi:Zn-dependent metalloprotease